MNSAINTYLHTSAHPVIIHLHRHDSQGHSSPIMTTLSPVELSLQTPLLFKRVLEKPSHYNLTLGDKLLLEDGRRSMINHTRYGFILGATLSPIPLFRGQYALQNLRHLPPLMDRESQRPNPIVLRSRLIWIVKSVVLTTLGSGLGTWIGFRLGLRSMDRSISSIPGARDRLLDAFLQARQELESNSTPAHDHPSSHPTRSSPSASKHPWSLETPDDRSSQDSSEWLPPAHSSPQSDRDQDDDGHRMKPSRWQELRSSPRSHPSTWEAIRNQTLRPPPSPSRSPSEAHPAPAGRLEFDHTKDSLDPSTHPDSQLPVASSPTQDEFGRLLDRERDLSAGIILPPPSDRPYPTTTTTPRSSSPSS